MKKLILALALFAPLASASLEADGSRDSKLKYCESVADLAELVMSKRQDGVTISQLLTVADDHPLMTAMIKVAYDSVSTYYSPDMISHSVVNYRNQWHMRCLKDNGLM